MGDASNQKWDPVEQYKQRQHIGVQAVCFFAIEQGTSRIRLAPELFVTKCERILSFSYYFPFQVSFFWMILECTWLNVSTLYLMVRILLLDHFIWVPTYLLYI